MWSDEPEARLLIRSYEKSDPLWECINLKQTTKYGREIAAGKLKPFKLRDMYEDFDWTFVLTEPTEPVERGRKPSKIVISRDHDPSDGSFAYHSTIVANRTKTKWTLTVTRDGGGFNSVGGVYNDLPAALYAGLRRLVSARSRHYTLTSRDDEASWIEGYMSLQDSMDALESARTVIREARESYRLAQKAEDAARAKMYDAERQIHAAEDKFQTALAQSRMAPKKDAIPATEASKHDAKKEWLGT